MSESLDTPLDQAHAAMQMAAEDAAARLRFYERLADAELFLLLAKEAEGDVIEPQIFPLEDGAVVLAFDREERLSRFADGIVPYAALSGRALVGLLQSQGLGLGLNLDVAPSSILLEAEAINWLSQYLNESPDQLEAQPKEFLKPSGLPQVLLESLAVKLATAQGLALRAYLVGVVYDDGRRGHLLGFVDAVEPAQAALAQAVQEALVFSGLDAAALDVTFVAAQDPVAAQFAKLGLGIDIPEAPKPSAMPGAAPGMDPDAPPRLR
ncbi:MAG: SseB family protein [Mangrovicoccus sp.]